MMGVCHVGCARTYFLRQTELAVSLLLLLLLLLLQLLLLLLLPLLLLRLPRGDVEAASMSPLAGSSDCVLATKLLL